MNILMDSVLESNNFFPNNKAGWSNKTNPCPLCSDTKGKCGVSDPIVNCRTHVDGYSVGDRLNDYHFTKVSRSGDLGVWKHESAWDAKGYEQNASRRLKKAIAQPKLKKWQQAKQPIQQLSQDLRSLVDQLAPTKKAVDFLNNRFSTNKTSSQWQELGYFSATGRENKLTNPVPGYIAGMKLKDPNKASKIFYAAFGTAINIPIYSHDGCLVGHQPKNFSQTAPKYTANSYKYKGNREVNSSHIKTPLNTVEMPLQNAIAVKGEGLDLWESEGILKPLVASDKHQINILGSMSGTPSQPWQTKRSLLAIKPSRYILAVDAGALVNKNVYNRSLRTIEFISKLRDELGLNFEIYVADWGQLLTQDKAKDVDDISIKTLKSCNLIPASVWVGSETQIWTFFTMPNACSYIYYLRTGGSTPSKCPNSLLESTFNLYTASNTENQSFSRSLRYIDDLELAANHHPLFSRFLAKEKLAPLECFAIAKELAWFEGGEDVYSEYLHPDYQVNDGSESNVKNFVSVARRIKVGYDKGGLFELLNASSVVRLNSPKTINVASGHQQLKNQLTQLTQAVNSETTITLVEASTGIGKTEILVNLMGNNPDRDLVISVPSHDHIKDLKHRFFDKFGSEAQVLIQCELDVSQKLKSIYSYLHSIGAGEAAYKILTSLARYGTRAILREYIDGSDYFFNKEGECVVKEEFAIEGLEEAIAELTEDDYLAIKKYVDNSRAVTNRNQKSPRIVTHQFYRYKAAAFAGMPVVCDEDPYATFYSISKMPVGLPTTLASSKLKSKDLFAELADRVKDLKDYESIEISDITSRIDTMELVRFFHSRTDYNNSYAVLGNASKLVKIGDRLGVICTEEDIPPGTNLIITSATCRASFYQAKFPNMVKSINIDAIALLGNLIQIVEHKVGKLAISNNKNNIVETLVKLTEDSTVITYKNAKDLFDNSDDICHFGHDTGLDHLKGRFLSIIGTPQISRQDFLLAFVAAGNSLKGRNIDMKNQVCYYNAAKFRFYAFIDKALQQFQFELINERLAQAIGRARLVRFDCTVLLVSNFPLLQSQIVTSDEWLGLKDSLQLSDPSVDSDFIHSQLAIADATIEGLEDTTDKAIQLVDTLVGDKVNETIEQEGRGTAIVESFSRTNEQHRSDESKAGEDDGAEDAGLCRPAIEHSYLGDGDKACEARHAGAIDSRIADYLLGIVKLAVKADCADAIAGFRGHAVELDGKTVPLNKEAFKQAWKLLDKADQPKAKELIIQAFSEVATR